MSNKKWTIVFRKNCETGLKTGCLYGHKFHLVNTWNVLSIALYNITFEWTVSNTYRKQILYSLHRSLEPNNSAIHKQGKEIINSETDIRTHNELLAETWKQLVDSKSITFDFTTNKACAWNFDFQTPKADNISPQDNVLMIILQTLETIIWQFHKVFHVHNYFIRYPPSKKKAKTKRQNLGYQNELKATGNKITPSIPRDRSAFITCVSLPLTVNVAGLLSPRTLVLSFLVTTQLYEPRSKTCTLVISNVPSSLTVNRGSESVLIVSLSFFQRYCKTLLSYVAEHRNVTVLPVSTVCEVGCVSHTRVDCELLSDEPVRKRIVRNVFQFTKSTLTSKIELFSRAVVMLYKHTQATRWTIMKVPT